METETGIELLARLTKRPDISAIFPSLLPPGLLGRNGILEINGYSGTGKTLLMMDIIARCVLDVRLGGCGGDVVLFDLSHHRDLHRLVRVLKTSVKSRDNNGNLEKTVLECLNRLRIVPCFSLNQLLIGLYELEDNLQQNPKTALICIDSVTSVYWSTRARSSSGPIENPSFSKLAVVISRIAKQFNIPFIFTRQILFRSRSSVGPGRKKPAARGATSAIGADLTDDFLGKLWSKLSTLRMTMQKCQESKSLRARLSNSQTSSVISNLDLDLAPDGVKCKLHVQ